MNVSELREKLNKTAEVILPTGWQVRFTLFSNTIFCTIKKIPQQDLLVALPDDKALKARIAQYKQDYQLSLSNEEIRSQLMLSQENILKDEHFSLEISQKHNYQAAELMIRKVKNAFFQSSETRDYLMKLVMLMIENNKLNLNYSLRFGTQKRPCLLIKKQNNT